MAFNINYDIRELLSNQRIDYKNEGHIKGIFRVQSDKRGKILLDVYKLGFGFHHPRFLQTMEGGSDHHMNRFKELKKLVCVYLHHNYTRIHQWQWQQMIQTKKGFG